MEDQTTHKIPISQTLIQSKVLTFFNSMKAQRGEEATEEEFEVSKCWFIGVRHEAILITFKCKVKQQAMQKL